MTAIPVPRRVVRPRGQAGAVAVRDVAGLLRGHGARVALAASAASVAALSGAGLLAASTWLLQRAADRPPVLTLMVAIVAVRALALLRAVARWQERTAVHAVGLAVVRDLRTDVARRLVPRVPEGLHARPGAVLDGIVRDLAAVERALVSGAVPVVAAAVTAVVAVVVAAALAPRSALPLLVGLTVGQAVVPAWARRLTRTPRTELAAARAGQTSATVDLLADADELAVAGTGAPRREHLRDRERVIAGLERRLAVREGVVGVLMAAVAGATLAGVAWTGVGAVGDGRTAPVALGALLMLAVGAFDPVVALPPAWQRIDEAVAAWRRVAAVVDAPVPVHAGSVSIGAHTVLPVTLEDVRVRRPGADRDALTDVDLRLAAGDRVLVTGPSGAGKSTLAATLVRFLAPRSGRYTVAGVPVDRVDADWVRSRIGLAGQDAHVFPTSLEANLRLAAPDAADDDLWRALAAVDLETWARTLPDGLAALLGPDGTDLSGGQRRRLATAQLLLADVEALVLDEPTAELDPVTARRVVDRVAAAAAGRPLIVVTHDPDLDPAATARIALAGGDG